MDPIPQKRHCLPRKKMLAPRQALRTNVDKQRQMGRPQKPVEPTTARGQAVLHAEGLSEAGTAAGMSGAPRTSLLATWLI